MVLAASARRGAAGAKHDEVGEGHGRGTGEAGRREHGGNVPRGSSEADSLKITVVAGCLLRFGGTALSALPPLGSGFPRGDRLDDRRF